jgi:hypothetical protein
MRHRDIDKQYKDNGKRWRRLRGRRDDPDTTKRYTPQDVQSLVAKAGNGSGIIRPDTGDLRMPPNIEAIGEGEQTNAPPRILFVIITLAILFILIVAYFISKMPTKG